MTPSHGDEATDPSVAPPDVARFEDAAWRHAAARNLAAWHVSSVRALGWRPFTTDSWWFCPTPAPNIYHCAISLRQARDAPDRTAMVSELARHLRRPDSMHVSVCDSWNELPLARIGLDQRSVGPWFARAGAPVPAPPHVSDDDRQALTITEVRTPGDLAVFERTVIEGFGARFPLAPFDIHDPAILDDHAMHAFLGWTSAGGRRSTPEPVPEPVSVSMAYVDGGLIGVYGVATVPGARGRGFATAITVAALAVDPATDAVLQPSRSAESLYRHLGFVAAGEFSHWS